MRFPRIAALAATACIHLAFTADDAAAQSRAWVDPSLGSDVLGAVQTNPTGGALPPFRTIGAAISAIGTGPGAVLCLPGIYSPVTNGESFPIVMRNGISVHGVAGARATIVAGLGTMPYTGPGLLPMVSGVFLPTIPNSRSLIQEVLFECSGLTDPSTAISQLTLQGGDIQIYCEAELTNPTFLVTGCVLDMLDGVARPFDEATPLGGPTFGVLAVTDYDFMSRDPDGAEYSPIRIHFLNNTVIMDWQSGPDVGGQRFSCRQGAVAFCDTSDPLTNPAYPASFASDPFARQAGFGLHNIQNNIIRTLPNEDGFVAGTATLGVDASDTATAVGGGTRSGPTNAFDVSAARTISPGGPSLPMFLSIVIAPSTLPVPWIDVNPANAVVAPTILARDPAFVGEYYARIAGATATDLAGRDWRLLPSSAYVDQGSSPVEVDGVAFGLTAVNGTQYFRPIASPYFPDPSDAFDDDFESYGNVRIVANPNAPYTTDPEVDIGADEVCAFVLARSHANDSIDHNATAAALGGYPQGVGAGQSVRGVITPSAGTIDVYRSLAAFGTPWSTVPSALFPATPVPGPGPGYDASYVPLTSLLVAGFPVPSSGTYFAPFDATAHVFGAAIVPDTTSLFPAYATWQTIFNPPSPALPFVTNAQSELTTTGP